MHDRETSRRQNDHGPVENHKGDLVVGELTAETLAELDGSEACSREEEDSGNEEDF
jgi:hypothetical protein